MLDDNTLGSRILANPSIVQSQVITELNNRWNGTYEIADPNNTFNVLLEMASSVCSQFVRAEDAKFDGIYKRRATTAAQLANHLSDFDYVNLMSHPSSVELRMFMDRDYLFQNAREVPNTDYRKVTIPATTSVKIGDRFFGIYYPIDIMLNTVNNAITVIYNTDNDNPLFSLSGNLIGDAAEYTRDGINYLDIIFPIYQFVRTESISTVDNSSGYSRQLSYADNFYAVRVYHKFTNSSGWVEIAQTLSETVYDPAVPTAKVTILSDVKKVDIRIPHVYFANSLMGRSVKVEVYTTQGALDTIITQAEAESITINFDIDNQSDGYSNIFSQIPTLSAIPAADRITGGSNGLTFEQLRSRVVSGSLYTTVPITPLDLEAAVTDAGFKLTRYLDNIPKRIYYATRGMVGGRNGNVPITVSNALCRLSTIDQVDTIISHEDSSLTILPTTIFKYNETANISTPLTDAEVTSLQSLSKMELASLLNTTVHTRQPFHILVYTGDKPQAKTFDLTSPTTGRLHFVRENSRSPVRMQVVNSLITHEGNNTGGYRLRLAVVKTTSMKDIDESDLLILVSFQDKSGGYFHTTASYVSETETITIYQVNIPVADYYITQDRYIRTILTSIPGTSATCLIPLDLTMEIKTLIRKSLYPSVVNDSLLMTNIPVAYSEDYLVMCQQTLQMTLGTDLSDSVFNAVNAQYGPLEYERYAEDVYHTYTVDQFERDDDGIPVFPLVKTHSAGDVVMVDGSPLIQYHAGDIVLDTFGQPIVSRSREIEYYVSTIQVDARLFASESLDDIAYINSMASEISGYASILTDVRDRLIEQTRLYFMPTRTLGSTLYSTGNNVTSYSSLGIAFTVRYYVSYAVFTNEALKKVIAQQTAAVIRTRVADSIISLTEIAKSLKSVLGDNIVSIDVLGINGQPDVQTLIPKETDATPMIAPILNVKDDGTLSLDEDVTVQFKLAV